MAGRFAPSPTGDLHLGNLRTAAVAWLSAMSQGLDFLVRMEDLDRHQSSLEHERSQLADLAAIGVTWTGEVVRQSDRFARYDAAIAVLEARGLVYECFCSRREIREEVAAAASAPHGPPGSYPGTCRDLGEAERAARQASGRRPALRLRSDGRTVGFVDQVAGPFEGVVDDVVLRRNDGVPAYNLAVVVDDAAQGVTEVVRGDDLLESTPRQIHLQDLLGLPRPSYLHVPLVLDDDGERLAKRKGDPTTLAELAVDDVSPSAVVEWIARSLDLADAEESVQLAALVPRFDVARLPRAACPRPTRWPHGDRAMPRESRPS
ncbi:MAG: tRNA glutamyl-Q(34) synthetase GluQRS [Ilumatobacteraceae bacterium]